MKMIGSKIEHPILVTLAALVLVFPRSASSKQRRKRAFRGRP
jgi:hypothetical protein